MSWIHDVCLLKQWQYIFNIKQFWVISVTERKKNTLELDFCEKSRNYSHPDDARSNSSAARSEKSKLTYYIINRNFRSFLFDVLPGFILPSCLFCFCFCLYCAGF